MSRIEFGSADSDRLNRPPEPPKPEPHRTPNCPHCGSFCRIQGEYMAYDGSGTQLYVSFDCPRCGEFTESMW